MSFMEQMSSGPKRKEIEMMNKIEAQNLYV